MASRRLNLSAIQVSAGILAALTGAIAASFLGVGGTLVGAGVGSLASTVGGEGYKHYLERTHERLRGAVDVRRYRTARSAVVGRVDPAVVGRVDPAVAQNRLGVDGLPQAMPAGTAAAMASAAAAKDGKGKRPRWLVLTAITVGTFLIAVAVITVIELSAGKNLNALLTNRPGGGATVGGVVGGQNTKPTTPATKQTASATPPATPSAGPSSSVPVSPTPSSGSGGATPTPSSTLTPGSPNIPAAAAVTPSP